MAKKAVPAPKRDDLSLKADASLVHSFLYLLTNKNRKRNLVASVFGFLKGGILPLSSFVIFHYGLNEAIQEGNTRKIIIYSIIGFSGIVSSLNNVQEEIKTMLRKNGIIPWLYAILLEGNAMFVGGSILEDVISILAFLSVLLSNWIKMTYLSLLPKGK